MVLEEYPRNDGTRYTYIYLRILWLATRLDECLGGNAAVRRSLVLQSESLDYLEIALYTIIGRYL